MERDATEVLSYLIEIEKVAEEILADRASMIDFGRRRHKTREAIRAMKAADIPEKSWFCFNNMFIKMPTSTAKENLQKDYDNLSSKVTDLENGLKPKVAKLRDLELKDELKGFNLKPLSNEDIFIN